jgi:hypothetical protein
MNRFCQRCQSYELHDKIPSDPAERDGTSGRVLSVIFTLGISELLIEYSYRCQKCYTISKCQ